MFSNISKKVSLSRGGKASQSSWNEPLLMKDEFRDERRFGRRSGLPGCDDDGVSGSRGCVSSLLPPSVAILVMSTAVASSWIALSDADLGILTGSDMWRAWFARTCCWKKYRSGSFPRNELDLVPRRCKALTTMAKVPVRERLESLKAREQEERRKQRESRKHVDIVFSVNIPFPSAGDSLGVTPLDGAYQSGAGAWGVFLTHSRNVNK